MPIGLDGRGASTEVATSANLHTLNVDITALRRLLDRRTADGVLIQADPALIKATITAGRAELRRVNAILREVPEEAAGLYREVADSMAMAVAELENLLVVLETATRGAKPVGP